MQDLRQYILSVTSAALLCTILGKIVGKNGATEKMVSSVLALFLLFTVIQQVAQIGVHDVDAWFDNIAYDAEEAVRYGENETTNALRESINQQVRTYILDKAAALGATLEVEVILSQEPLPTPKRVVLKGDVSPYVKQRLKQILEEELGIPGEQQVWNGMN